MFAMNPLYELSSVSVGQHFYWQLGDFEVHGQVLMTSDALERGGVSDESNPPG